MDPKGDAFRDVFKYYKRKNPAPDLTDVIDFNDEPSFLRHGITRLQPRLLEQMNNDGKQFLGLETVIDWNMYQMVSHPGLYFIRNPFNKEGIEYWSKQCFEIYCKHPNPTNVKEDLKNLLFSSDDLIIEKLRWATLGYWHNWDTKEYSENYKGVFPDDLALLSKTIAYSLGFEHFLAEAAIVNYYALDSSIGGHTDHSEYNHTAPLISISFGQSGIFLLGGPSKSVKPSAMLISNGDIVVMAGESRLCYHGVPKIIPNPKLIFQGRWSGIMSKMRLNINVRQVNINTKITAIIGDG